MFPDFLSFTLIKIGILALLLLYIVFAFIVLNQVRVMNNIIKEVYSSTILYVLAFVHLFFAISLFVLAFVIL